MKHYSFLISLAFVNVSFSYNPTDYISALIITNEHVELAFNMKYFAIQDQIVLNGLEHVIKKIVENKYELYFLNNMFTVPEYVRTHTEMRDCEATQWDVRDAIETELNIPVPKVPKEYIAILEYLRKNESNMALQFGDNDTPELIDFRKLIENLGKIRRELTGKALGNILMRITDGGNPDVVTENVTNLINEKSSHDTDKNKICRALITSRRQTEIISLECTCKLICLFMGTKFPESHIREMEINSNETCIIRDYYKDDYNLDVIPIELRKYYIKDDIPSNDRTKTFKQIEGQWYQVIGDVVQPLKELLE